MNVFSIMNNREKLYVSSIIMCMTLFIKGITFDIVGVLLVEVGIKVETLTLGDGYVDDAAGGRCDAAFVAVGVLIRLKEGSVVHQRSIFCGYFDGQIQISFIVFLG